MASQFARLSITKLVQLRCNIVKTPPYLVLTPSLAILSRVMLHETEMKWFFTCPTQLYSRFADGLGWKNGEANAADEAKNLFLFLDSI